MRDETLSVLDLQRRISIVANRLCTKIAKEKILVQKASPYNTYPSDSVHLPVGEKFLGFRYKEILRYLVLYHFFHIDDKHRCYFYLDLQEHILKLPDSFWLSVLLENKDFFLLWLVEQQTMTTNEFFGAICNEKMLLASMNSIIVRFEKTFFQPVRRPIRRKGYKDKGSLPKDPSGAIRRQEQSRDIWIQMAEEQRKLKKQLRSSEIDLFRLHFSEGRILPTELNIKFKILLPERTEIL